MENTIEKKRVWKALFVALIVLCAYLAVLTAGEAKKNSMLGESTTPATITFSGHGEVTAVPDIANIYFTISKDASTVKDAQAGVAEIEKKALDALKVKGVAEKDIKTADASVNPKYEYKQAVCPQGASYCGNSNQVIVGYTASESITVKVRNVDASGDIMQALGTAGVSNLNGPNFAIDNEDAVKTEARKKAINDAREKAEALAKDLGVHLGKIASFSENGSTPIMYAQSAMMKDSAVIAPAAPAEIPKGENTISSDVTITYEIR